MAKCVAKAKSTLKPCGNSALKGARTCKFHGGANQISGVLSPKYKTGKYSKSLQGKMLADYHQGINDAADILQMSDELSLIDTRIQQLSSEVTEDKHGSTWAEAIEALVDLYNEVLAESKTNKVLLYAYQEVEDIIRSGWNREEQWNEILKTLEVRRKIAESEVKRLVASKSVVPVTQVREFYRKIADSYKHAVLAHADPTTAHKILTTASHRESTLIGG